MQNVHAFSNVFHIDVAGTKPIKPPHLFRVFFALSILIILWIFNWSKGSVQNIHWKKFSPLLCYLHETDILKNQNLWGTNIKVNQQLLEILIQDLILTLHTSLVFRNINDITWSEPLQPGNSCSLFWLVLHRVTIL